MRKTIQIGLALATLSLASLGAPALAGEGHLLKTENGFLIRMGERALPVAPGVYEVTLSSGERVRVAFGDEGRHYDRARLQARLQEIEAGADNKMAQSKSVAVLTQALRGLEDDVTVEGKAAVSGATCTYPYDMDGGHSPGMVGGTTWGNASIGLGLDFGPPAPFYPKRSAYTYVEATAMLDQLYTSWNEDYDEVIGGLGIASTSSSVNCGYAVWSCYSWESFSYVREYSCKGGYRSLTRIG